VGRATPPATLPLTYPVRTEGAEQRRSWTIGTQAYVPPLYALPLPLQHHHSGYLDPPSLETECAEGTEDAEGTEGA
jgi:hypothetical protein